MIEKSIFNDTSVDTQGTIKKLQEADDYISIPDIINNRQELNLEETFFKVKAPGDFLSQPQPEARADNESIHSPNDKSEH